MIFRSPHAALTIPETSLAEYVLQRAPEFGNKPALIDGSNGRTITYKELAPTIHKLAAGFLRHGFGKGDVLATPAFAARKPPEEAAEQPHPQMRSQFWIVGLCGRAA